MNEIFKCPECDSNSIKFRFKVNHKNNVYAEVTEEIQCASCYMDIPANLFIVDEDTSIEDNQKIWKTLYKPEHIKNAEECPICLSKMANPDSIKHLACCHKFHSNCIEKWLINSQQCPLCRHQT